MTLKDYALRWFMDLEDDSFPAWDDMKKAFLNKYNDYCKNRNSNEDIFAMQQKED